MRKTNVFKKFYNNLFNLSTFPGYMKEGFGRALIYAFVISIAFGSIQGILVAKDFSKTLNTTESYLMEEEYKFTLENGIFTIGTNPIKIEEGGSYLYIDSTKNVSDREELKSIVIHNDLGMLVLRDGISIYSQGEEINLMYSDVLEGTLSNEDILLQLNLMKSIMPVIIVLLIIMMYFIDFLITCGLVAIFAMVSNFMLGLRLRFTAIYSLSIYAATLPSLLVLILNLIVKNVYLAQAMMIGTLLYVMIILRYIRKDMIDNKDI